MPLVFTCVDGISPSTIGKGLCVFDIQVLTECRPSGLVAIPHPLAVIIVYTIGMLLSSVFLKKLFYFFSKKSIDKWFVRVYNKITERDKERKVTNNEAVSDEPSHDDRPP